MQNKSKVPISVLIPTKNEERNLEACLASLSGWASEIVLVDSGSTDGTLRIADEHEVTALQFRYEGGWPKKRNWALENHQWRNEWVLLLDADEIISGDVKHEIELAIQKNDFDGYWINFQIVFLGRMLKFGDTNLWKLSLFRNQKGRYEQRLADQDASMADMEIHEHVVVDGPVGRLKKPVRHENVNSLSHYIDKHNQYSNWEAGVYLNGSVGEVSPSFFGSQAQRRRALRQFLMRVPGFPLFAFCYTYFLKLGFLDGRSGFYYAVFRLIQFTHINAKIYEARVQKVK